MMHQQVILTVLGTTKQETETYDHWSWVEASVWTKPMLAALDNGVKGGKWFSLWDKQLHKLMPNAYFAEQGLFSLKEAHVMACQSR